MLLYFKNLLINPSCSIIIIVIYCHNQQFPYCSTQQQPFISFSRCTMLWCWYCWNEILTFCGSFLRCVTVWCCNNPVSLLSSSTFHLIVIWFLTPWEVPSVLDLQKLNHIIHYSLQSLTLLYVTPIQGIAICVRHSLNLILPSSYAKSEGPFGHILSVIQRLITLEPDLFLHRDLIKWLSYWSVLALKDRNLRSSGTCPHTTWAKRLTSNLFWSGLMGEVFRPNGAVTFRRLQMSVAFRSNQLKRWV